MQTTAARRPRRRLAAALAGGGVVVGALAACGSTAPSGAAGSRSGSGREGGATTSTPAASPGTAGSASSTSAASAPASGAAFLTAWGATTASWADNHEPDPGRSGGWWPRLPDNRDTYQSLDVVGGRVVGYTLALYPSVSEAEARTRLANDLPIDATVVVDRAVPGCRQLVEQSPTLTAVTGLRVLVELRSSGGSYDPASVSTIVTAPLSPAASPPGSC